MSTETKEALELIAGYLRVGQMSNHLGMTIKVGQAMNILNDLLHPIIHVWNDADTSDEYPLKDRYLYCGCHYCYLGERHTQEYHARSIANR